MFALFVSFLVALGLSLPQIATLDVLAFIYFLLQSGMSASNPTNHLTAIRSMFIIYNFNTTPFRDNSIPHFVKAFKLNKPFQHTDYILFFVFKALYLLAFYSFLRLSNILPHSVSPFDSTLYVGAVIFAGQYAVVIIKWSKTMQDRSKVASISIPALVSASICPVSALTHMLHIQTSPDDPLF